MRVILAEMKGIDISLITLGDVTTIGQSTRRRLFSTGVQIQFIINVPSIEEENIARQKNITEVNDAIEDDQALKLVLPNGIMAIAITVINEPSESTAVSEPNGNMVVGEPQVTTPVNDEPETLWMLITSGSLTWMLISSATVGFIALMLILLICCCCKKKKNESFPIQILIPYQ